MKFIMNREVLLETLNHVAKGLSYKTPMPVLTGIKIEASQDEIIFTTTNREVSVQVVLPVSPLILIDTPGECVVPGKYFIEIIKKVEGKLIEFTLFEENTIKIIADRSNFTLISFDKSNFPAINFDNIGNPVVIKSHLLRQVIKQTAFAAGTSEARIVLTGVCFQLEEDNLRVIATDSFRLSRKTSKLAGKYSPIQINVPSKALDELSKILDEFQDDVLIYIINNKILFKIKNVSFMSRLIEGTFPDTTSLFPNNHIIEMEINKNDLISTVDRTSVFTSSDSTTIIKMVLNRDKSIQISSNSSEIGKVVDEIYPVKISGVDQFQTAFSSKYFLEALKAFESQIVTIKFTGEIKPFIITGKDDPDLVQLILPVRIF